MLILYDAVGTLADAVGLALQVPTYVVILMPPLLEEAGEAKELRRRPCSSAGGTFIYFTKLRITQFAY